MNKNLLNNSKMAEYYSIFARMLFNIRFAYYSTWIPELRYSPRQRIWKWDPASLKFVGYSGALSLWTRLVKKVRKGVSKAH